MKSPWQVLAFLFAIFALGWVGGYAAGHKLETECVKK